MRYYSGIGSRKATGPIMNILTETARFLETKGFILRSGGADGCDLAFEEGVVNPANKEIYLPWKGFNKNPSPLFNTNARAAEIARLVIEDSHWNALSQAGRKLHSRNVHQLLGLDLETPSSFVACWTPQGKVSGGTATAIKLADLYEVPVFNFGIYEDDEQEEMYEAFQDFFRKVA